MNRNIKALKCCRCAISSGGKNKRFFSSKTLNYVEKTRFKKVNNGFAAEQPYNFLGPINKLTPADAIVRGFGDSAIILGISVLGIVFFGKSNIS